MSAPKRLKDLYSHELQDLYSSNDQMQKVMKTLAEKTSDEKLTSMMKQAGECIAKHTESLKELLEAEEGSAKKEHCKGMEGLVADAIRRRPRYGGTSSRHEPCRAAERTRFSLRRAAPLGT